MRRHDEVEEIYYTYSDDVYYYLLSMTRNEVIAEDMLQATFLQVMNGIATFRGRCSLKTWIFTIARHEYFHWTKKNPPMLQLDEEVPLHDKMIDSYEKREQVSKILKYIDNLEEPHRSLMVFRLINDLTFREIAIILGKTESWARVTFMRDKHKLLEDLREELE